MPRIRPIVRFVNPGRHFADLLLPVLPTAMLALEGGRAAAEPERSWPIVPVGVAGSDDGALPAMAADGAAPALPPAAQR